MSFAKLDDLGHKLEALEHALAILGADEATHMAVGGGEKRAEAMSALAGMLHRQATAPEIADWIEAAEAEPLNEDQQAALREFRRHYTNLTCLPAEFVERQTTARMRSEQLWRDLRAKNDWAGFLPSLEGVISLVREEAAMRADKTGLGPYDALMEQYDPGNRAADISPVFAELKAFLRDFVPEALAVQEERLAKSPLEAAVGELSDRPPARTRPRHDGRRRLRPHPWQPVGLAPSLLRRRADRRAHHHALSHQRIPLRADGRAARDRPRALRAEPARRMGALAARQGARHGGA